VISGVTRDALGDEAVVEAIEPIEAKGKREPITAYRLVGLRAR
jgi:class 3 adenylate cyclase